MKSRKIGRFTAAGFVVLILLVVVILLSNSLRRSSHIILPDMTAASESAPGTSQSNAPAITPIAVTPQTAAAAVESLSRPASYRRAITIERLWEGGSGTTEVAVAVRGQWTRTDVTMSDGRTRHTITDGRMTYVWYGTDSQVFQGPAGDISPDQEQGILTYEEILDLPPEQIETADYRSLAGVNCIYVETGEDDDGYTSRYWVSVDTGLLAAAERLEDGKSIYRMGSPTLDAAGPTDADFTLPDGTVVGAGARGTPDPSF